MICLRKWTICDLYIYISRRRQILFALVIGLTLLEEIATPKPKQICTQTSLHNWSIQKSFLTKLANCNNLRSAIQTWDSCSYAGGTTLMELRNQISLSQCKCREIPHAAQSIRFEAPLSCSVGDSTLSSKWIMPHIFKFE